jgi:transglutaminase-like putative cysteine protease
MLLACYASVAIAQAPVITPAGDPSVKSDTIYRLAVNPADYPDEPFVYLLDDGVVRFEADGRGTRTYRQVVQILTQEAAERFGEQVFSYSSSREKLTVNWLRVVRSDGSVVSDKATHEQESDAPAALESPVYTDAKMHRATLGGVAPGTLVDWSYTVETLQPIMPGDFFSGWRVTTGRLTRRSRFVVDVPASLTPRIKERNLFFPRRVVEENGRRVYTWATQEVPKSPAAEPFAADSNDVVTTVTVGPPVEWGDVARWYANLSRDRYAMTPALESRLAEVVGGQKSRDDSLRALYRWVAQDFRYVSVSLGMAGYQPRPPAATFETRYGDCKDKATLFVALSRRMGFRAYPVLLASGGGVDTSLPTTQQFDHMIAAVALDSGRERAGGATDDSVNGRASSGAVALANGLVRTGGADTATKSGRASSGAVERPGGYLYLDLTADAIPVGLLPPSEAGEFALVVHPDGRGEEVKLPRDSAVANRGVDVVAGTLAPDGSFTGRLTRTRTGSAQLELREALSRTITGEQRVQIARNLADGVFDGATGDSLELFDGRDLSVPARISVVIRGAKATTSAGGSDILTLPLVQVVSPRLVTEVEGHMPRKFPIDAAQVLGTEENITEFRITLPEGSKARLPANVAVTGPFGTYASTYEQAGRELHILRRTVGARGVLPPERAQDLLQFLRAIARDDARYIILEHS